MAAWVGGASAVYGTAKSRRLLVGLDGLGWETLGVQSADKLKLQHQKRIRKNGKPFPVDSL